MMGTILKDRGGNTMTQDLGVNAGSNLTGSGTGEITIVAHPIDHLGNPYGEPDKHDYTLSGGQKAIDADRIHFHTVHKAVHS